MSKIHLHYKNDTFKNGVMRIIGDSVFFKGEPQEEPEPEPQQQQVDPWGKYWTTISDSIPQEQVATWMNEWGKDSSFPWNEVLQDYVNVNAGESPAFKITPEGGLEMSYNPFAPSSGNLGKMTPELATPFGWDEGTINQFNQNVDMMANAPLYPYASQIVKERERERGIGEAPIQGVNIPIGGQLLSGEASKLAPESLLNQAGKGGMNPLTMTEFVMGGG